MVKLIIVTGGVLSGVGKGIAAASIGALLRACDKTVFMQKMDGYLNVDAGTINPYKHGECFVTTDGAETDLDIGHYERFIDTDLNKTSIYTMGTLYQEILNAERKGDYLGSDVQMIPHMSTLIKKKITDAYHASSADVGIIEIGGTVGDIENDILVESCRQLRAEYGASNVLFVHLTYIPYLLASKELKTKPTQNSVKDLRMKGIVPDLLLLRADYKIPQEICQKVSTMCGIPASHVIPMPTLESIYMVPGHIHQYGVGEIILSLLGYQPAPFLMHPWTNLTNHIIDASKEITIAIVGKYGTFEDAYYSLNESLKVSGRLQDARVSLTFLDPSTITLTNVSEILGSYSGICIPGGFGTRGTEGMILACQYAREQKIPFLGICLGSQIMAIEFARNVLGHDDATSEEFDPENTSKHHVVHIMHDQKTRTEKGGTMRLGTYECTLTPGSFTQKTYRKWTQVDTLTSVSERHRHRYEFNNDYRQAFEIQGFHISGTSPDGNLVEMVEIVDHPYMLATQAHPELSARPTRPHPLMMGFIDAMLG